jgi:quercetin dioxygenase-like cupin family protein
MTKKSFDQRIGNFLLGISFVGLCAITAAAQAATDKCRPPAVIPTANEPPAKLIVDAPLPGPLAARGVVIIGYCAENLHLVPVFGPDALAVSPRVGHLHVRVDDSTWVWADASGNPIILMGLSPGPHKVLLELEDSNHHSLDQGTVSFVIPGPNAKQPGSKRTDLQRHDLSTTGRELIQVRVDFDPGYTAPRHTHFGEEIIYVIEGELEYVIDGKTFRVKAGDVLFVPAGVIHTAKNIGTGNAAELATYVVEKGKPLITLVK